LEQTPLRLTLAPLVLAFAEIKPPFPRSALAVPRCTISASLRAFALSIRSPHFGARI